MIDFIREAGFGIYPVMAFGFAAVFVALKHLLTPRSSHVATVKWLMALTGMAGLLGTITGLQKSAEYIHETPEKWIFLLGLRESLNNLVGAAVLVSVAMLAMLAAHVKQSGDGEPARVPVTT